MEKGDGGFCLDQRAEPVPKAGTNHMRKQLEGVLSACDSSELSLPLS